MQDKTQDLQSVPLAFGDGSQRAFYHRGTRADKGVIQQIFLNRDYALEHLKRGPELVETYREIVREGKTPLILDAGSNIGASVCWFASQFPHSRIVAFEPEASNFALLGRNAAGLNVELNQAAIGYASGRTAVVDPGEGEWGFRTVPDEGGDCILTGIPDVMARADAEGLVPFIAKIDIEGGEADLFREPNDWADRFPLLIVELHDWMLPKQRTAQSFLRCIVKFDRDFVFIGENVFSIRNG